MQTLRKAAAVAGMAAALGACGDFIGGAGDNPNVLPGASAGQLYTSIQVNTFFWNEGQIARFSAMWTNQMAGTDRQFASFDQYSFGEQDADIEFGAAYASGGLVDIRAARAQADSAGFHALDGILKIHEAFLIGMTASVFGDVPYSQALVIGKPAALDPQPSVYAAVQALLDQSIAQLAATPSTAEAGLLTSRDMGFAGDRARWTAVAHSLKARLYMHWVEAQANASTAAAANTACGGDCLARALAEARQGIASDAGTWRAIHSPAGTEANLWYQFVTDRAGYLSGGKLLIDFLASRADPRLERYFAPRAGGGYLGSAPGTSPGDPGASASQLNTIGYAEPGADLPIVSCAETQFIVAEVEARRGATAPAQDALVAGVRCALDQAGRSTVAAAAVLPSPLPTGDALLREIAMQKYVALFLNVEAWNDYKRTCLPDVAAVKVGTSIEGVPVPGRLYYGLTERQTNPNIPVPDQQPARNTNDPAPCP